MKFKQPVPVIDLFAGPGGLGEGFSQVDWKVGSPFFRIELSVEKDLYAYKTLKLRSFLRKFPYGALPQEYYEYLRKETDPGNLFLLEKYSEQARKADEEVWQATLGIGKDFDRKLDNRIEKILCGNTTWVLIGGPPCQAYSIAGRSRNKGIKGYIPEKDSRHFLYQEYLRIIARHSPAVFVMENVKGLLSSTINGNQIFEQIESDLKNPSRNFPEYSQSKRARYRIFSLVHEPEAFDTEGCPVFQKENFIIRSEEYGIPQARHRVILLGVREDLCQTGVMPMTLRKKKHISVKEVLNLPKLRSGISRGSYNKKDWHEAIKKFPLGSLKGKIIELAGKNVFNCLETKIGNLSLPPKGLGGNFVDSIPKKIADSLGDWYMDSRLEGILNHAARTHIVADLHRYLYAACFAEIHNRSPRLHEFPELLKPEHKNRDTGHFNDRFRVQVSDRPACTITSHISKDGHYYIHFDPLQCRSLTVREAARLQTFPDNYFFCGNRTQQYVQVGNAVPPLLANQIAHIVKKFLVSTLQENGGQNLKRA